MSGWVILLSSQAAMGQLSVLSQGNPSKKWHDAQLALISDQLADASIRGELHEELQSQLKWLSAWKTGQLTTEALWDPKERPAPIVEPIVDPKQRATPLREKLFGKNAKPTFRDTENLEKLLAEAAGDVGVRQLHLHWLDQRQYRDTYTKEIAEAALRVIGLLESIQPQTDELKLAQTFCWYRRSRALAYLEQTQSSAKQPAADSKKMESDLMGAYSQLTALGGQGHPEFISLDIDMLMRDHWNGKGLDLLESNGQYLDSQWFLQKRVELLGELGWEQPRKEAAQVLAIAFPDPAEVKGGRASQASTKK